MSKVKKAIAVALVAACIVGSVGYSYVKGQEGNEEEVTYEETTLMYGDLTLSFTGEGTTQVASVSEYLDFDISAVRMQVDEVYVTSGTEVGEGDKLFKFTSDSYEELVSYYEKQVAEAKEAVEDAEKAYETGVEGAKLTYNENVSESSGAQAEYDAAVAELQAAVDSVYTDLVNAQTALSLYQTNIANNQYYIDAAVDDYKSAYETAKAATEAAKEQYESIKESYESETGNMLSAIANLQTLVSDTDDIEKNASDISSAVSALGSDGTTLSSLFESYIAAADYITECEEAEKQAQSAYESAKSTYEKNESNAEKEVESLTDEIEELTEKYEEKQSEQETELLKLQNTYEKALLAGENAQTEYDSTVTTLKAAVDEATETYSDLIEEQQALLSCSEGVVTAGQAGTLSAVSVAAEGYVFGDMAVVSYYDTSKIMISTEVDQTNIAKVAVGDTVSVIVEGSGELEGTVSEIASAATSGGSRSNVTYEVVVEIDNSDGALAAGSSAYVTFTYGEETDVYYTLTSALSDISDGTAKVKVYDEEGNITEKDVEIGTSTDQYTVIVSGLEADEKFLIESTGRKKSRGDESDESTPEGTEMPEEMPEGASKDSSSFDNESQE